MKSDRNFFHFRIASFEEFLVAFAEAVERWSAVNYRLALASASAAAEGIPPAFLAFLIAVCRYTDKFLCQLTRDKFCKGILIYISEFPFVENVEVAGENASVTLDDRVTGANTRHSAVLGRSAEKHTDVVIEIAHTDRMTRTEILVIFVEGDLQEFRVTLGCE